MLESIFSFIQDYFYHGTNHVSSTHQEVLEEASRRSLLARELKDELTELQAAQNPMAALVKRVRRNKRE